MKHEISLDMKMFAISFPYFLTWPACIWEAGFHLFSKKQSTWPHIYVYRRATLSVIFASGHHMLFKSIRYITTVYKNTPLAYVCRETYLCITFSFAVKTRCLKTENTSQKKQRHSNIRFCTQVSRRSALTTWNMKPPIRSPYQLSPWGREMSIV